MNINPVDPSSHDFSDLSEFVLLRRYLIALKWRRTKKGLQSVRILVVDGDKFALRATAQPLRVAGHEVVEAMKPEHVIAAAESGMYSVAIIDIFIPGMGGIEMIQRIRASSPGCKIVAISGGYADMPASDAINAALIIGADVGYLKPVDMDALLKNIRAWKEERS